MSDSIGHPWIEFPTTHWSQIKQAAGDREEEACREGLGRLLTRYLPVLQLFVESRWGVDHQRAEDLTQSFVEKRILEQNFLRNAQRERGKFRTFLLASLSSFVKDEWKREHRQKRHPTGGYVSIDETDEHEEMPNASVETNAADLLWARTVIAHAVERMRAECVLKGRMDIWVVFERRLWRPCFRDEPVISWKELAGQICVGQTNPNPDQLHYLQTTAQRTFRRAIESVVAEYAKGAVAEEIHHLLELLLHAPASGINEPSQAE
jgi:RNA polymerase sigma-70 factor (ECF subfamily)